MRQLRSELRHGMPVKRALPRAFWRWRHFFGYVLLATAIAYALATERTHSNQNRHTLAVQTREVLIAGCERQNVLRGALRSLVDNSLVATRHAFHDHTITIVQYRQGIKFDRSAHILLADTPCNVAINLPHG